jgi:hypothetical protein
MSDDSFAVMLLAAAIVAMLVGVVALYAWRR